MSILNIFPPLSQNKSVSDLFHKIVMELEVRLSDFTNVLVTVTDSTYSYDQLPQSTTAWEVFKYTVLMALNILLLHLLLFPQVESQTTSTWTQMLNIEQDSVSSVFFIEHNTNSVHIFFPYPDYHYIIDSNPEV